MKYRERKRKKKKKKKKIKIKIKNTFFHKNKRDINLK